jgi:adenosine deaminase
MSDGPGVHHDFIRRLPKAELHLHLEGTLEPELMMELAHRNNVELPYPDIPSIREAYVFSDLQSFLDIYYQGCSVLLGEQDFFDLTMAYLERVQLQGVCHVEVFFDPQAHTSRGVPFADVVTGIHRALEVAGSRWGLTSRLILSFLRHLPEADALDAWSDAQPFLDWITATGLDSSEKGFPPSGFTEVFARTRAAGLRAVAHAGEEGPPEYITEALDLLGVARVDHGVRCLEDPRLVRRLVAEQVPLTVCPLSNVKLGVFPSMAGSNFFELMNQGLMVTVNSDDPAYFGGYVAENYDAVASAFDLSRSDLAQLAANSIKASFLAEEEKAVHLAAIAQLEEEFGPD